MISENHRFYMIVQETCIILSLLLMGTPHQSSTTQAEHSAVFESCRVFKWTHIEYLEPGCW